MEKETKTFKYKEWEFKLRTDTLGFQKRTYFVLLNLNKMIKEYYGVSMLSGNQLDGEEMSLMLMLMTKEKDENNNYRFVKQIIEKLAEPIDCIPEIDYKENAELEQFAFSILLNFFLENSKNLEQLNQLGNSLKKPLHSQKKKRKSRRN